MDSPKGDPDEPGSQDVIHMILSLVQQLPEQDRERALEMLEKAIHPIQAPNAGEVLSAIVRMLPRQKEWNIKDIKQLVLEEVRSASGKEVSNALGYLTRKGQIRRVGYGRYLVDGTGVITSDEFGEEPSRYED